MAVAGRYNIPKPKPAPSFSLHGCHRLLTTCFEFQLIMVMGPPAHLLLPRVAPPPLWPPSTAPRSRSSSSFGSLVFLQRCCLLFIPFPSSRDAAKRPCSSGPRTVPFFSPSQTRPPSPRVRRSKRGRRNDGVEVFWLNGCPQMHELSAQAGDVSARTDDCQPLTSLRFPLRYAAAWPLSSTRSLFTSSYLLCSLRRLYCSVLFCSCFGCFVAQVGSFYVVSYSRFIFSELGCVERQHDLTAVVGSGSDDVVLIFLILL